MINKELVEALTKEMTDMQELADDKNAAPEIRSNARSYIRGVKKAIEIFEKYV